MANTNAVNWSMYPDKYEIGTPFSKEAGKEQRQYSLWLSGASPSEMGAHRLEFGIVNAKSGIVFARYDGQTYMGYNEKNPGSFDRAGECIEEHTLGISIHSLVALFATPPKPEEEEESTAKAPAATRMMGMFDLKPRRKWRAAFKLLEAPMEGHGSSALRFRVIMSGPYQGMCTATFQAEFLMHAFGAGV